MNKIKGLSLLLSGVVLGIAISFSPQAYAATLSLLGSKVDKVIVVKLDEVELGKAIAVDGVSYLPIRSLSNALGVGVDYTPTEINLTSSKGANKMEVSPETVEQETLTVNELSKKVISLKINIRNAKDVLSNKISSESSIASLQDNIDMLYRMRDTNTPGYSEDKVDNLQAQIDKTEKNLSDAEKNLPIWEAELVVLEAELSALQ